MAREKILIIDDDKTVHKVVGHVLKRSYDVISAYDGEEGLRLAKTVCPDLIISDVMMPNMDGYMLKESIKRIPELNLVPFVFLSSYSSPNAQLRGLMTGADDFLVKPFNPEILRKRISLLLDRSRIYREDSLQQFSEEVSSAFLPKQPPRIPGYDLSFKVQPARLGGGDIIDYVLLDVDNNSHFFIFGDVMGKGTKAKFFAFSFIGYFRGLIYPMVMFNERITPAALLSRLSKLVDVDPFLQDIFITGLVALFYPESNIFMYSNAGYMPGLLFDSSTQSIIELNKGGGIPGFSSSFYEEETVMLKPGDCLLIYSDGVNEAKNEDDEMMGVESIKKWLIDHNDLSADGISNGILQLVKDHAGGSRQYDDISVSVLKRVGEGIHMIS
ncbi:SpoIIE family protein phosphatase [bacterium]|nr:SpoIIE family protein phosphatase [bacterium]